jgi:hypothetical protein
VGRLSCPSKPANLPDGQVAQLRGAGLLDALGDHPPQCVADANLRCPYLTRRVVECPQREDRFRGDGLDPFVAGGPVVVQGDPPPAGRGPCLLFQLRDPSHNQPLPYLPNRDPSHL